LEELQPYDPSEWLPGHSVGLRLAVAGEESPAAGAHAQRGEDGSTAAARTGQHPLARSLPAGPLAWNAAPSGRSPHPGEHGGVHGLVREERAEQVSQVKGSGDPGITFGNAFGLE